MCLYSLWNRVVHLFVMLRRNVIEESVIFYSSNCAVYVIGDGFLLLKPTPARRGLLELKQLAFILVEQFGSIYSRHFFFLVSLKNRSTNWSIEVDF